MDPSDPILKIEFRPLSEIRSETLKLLSKRGKIPVDVEAIAEFDLKISLTPMPFKSRLSGCEGFLSGNLDEIIYYEHSDNEPRTRFTIAHELGHLVLHSNIIQQLNVSSLEDWREMIPNLPNDSWTRAETQANMFAAHLLVPLDALMEEMNHFRDQLIFIKAKKNFEPYEVYPYITPYLAKRFCVSEDVMLAQLVNNKIDPFSIL